MQRRTNATLCMPGADPSATSWSSAQLWACATPAARLVAVSLSYHGVTDLSDSLPLPTVHSLVDSLVEALAALRSGDEARALLADLCTPAEVHSLAERWHVARLLDAGGLTYREIHEATGVSTTTIVRVARFLRQEENRGYRLMLDRLKEPAS